MCLFLLLRRKDIKSKYKVEKINILDNRYPKQLREIYDPPINIYVKGDSSLLLSEKIIAITGCRDASKYGEYVSKYFSFNLARENVVIVSGLAYGIESYSHVGCLAAGGKTISVVATGLDNIYPKENQELERKILENGGCIISEYKLGVDAQKSNFPARNRIISGISNGILVVEAKEKSGSFITVDCALEQGKDIFVVPGNITSKYSVGTNYLIKQGAMLVTSYKDIIEYIK